MIRLLLFEDNYFYRKALQTFISQAEDIELVHSGESLDKAKELVSLLKPDVVIMDIDLPGISGIEGVRMVKEIDPTLSVCMLTVFEDEEKIFQSIKAGATGYLLKKDPPETIINAIRSLYAGESIINGQIARKILEYYATRPEQEPRIPSLNIDDYSLTKREKEILQLLIEGLSYKQISAQCFISMDTMFSHVRKIYNKLNIHSRSEIAAKFK